MNRRKEIWGDTRDPEGAGRRIYITKIWPSAKLDDLIEAFGGKSLLDGVYLDVYFAIVQFKRPRDKTNYCMRKTMTIKGHNIEIREDKGTQARGAPSTMPRSSRAMVPHKFSRSRSGSRDRDSYRERSRDRSRRHDRDRSRSKSSERSKRSDRAHERHHRRPSHRSPSQQTSSNLDESDPTKNRTAQDAIVPFIDQSGAVLNGDRGYNTLMPYSVELTLKLALDQGTFRNLSLIQLDEILAFIQSERNQVHQQAFMSNHWGGPQIPQFGLAVNMPPTSHHSEQIVPQIQQPIAQPSIETEPIIQEQVSPAEEQADPAQVASDTEIKSEIAVASRPAFINDTVALIRRAMRP